MSLHSLAHQPSAVTGRGTQAYTKPGPISNQLRFLREKGSLSSGVYLLLSPPSSNGQFQTHGLHTAWLNHGSLNKHRDMEVEESVGGGGLRGEVRVIRGHLFT